MEELEVDPDEKLLKFLCSDGEASPVMPQAPRAIPGDDEDCPFQVCAVVF